MCIRDRLLIKVKGRLGGQITIGSTDIAKLKELTAEVQEMVEEAKNDVKGCKPHYPAPKGTSS